MEPRLHARGFERRRGGRPRGRPLCLEPRNRRRGLGAHPRVLLRAGRPKTFKGPNLTRAACWRGLGRVVNARSPHADGVRRGGHAGRPGWSPARRSLLGGTRRLLPRASAALSTGAWGSAGLAGGGSSRRRRSVSPSRRAARLELLRDAAAHLATYLAMRIVWVPAFGSSSVVTSSIRMRIRTLPSCTSS